MAGDDWLGEDDDRYNRPLPTKPDEGAPSDATTPALPGHALVAVEAAITERTKFLAAWEMLSDKQKVFLNTWRECRFNANKAFRVLANTTYSTGKSTVNNWLAEPSFEYVRERMRGASVAEILNRDNLAARQDDVVETLMEPKPVLHQGAPTGYFEVEAAAAGKANEVLLRLGGHLKDKDVEVNVGVVIGPPTLNIQVMPTPPSKTVKAETVAIDAKFTEVPNDDWLES